MKTLAIVLLVVALSACDPVSFDIREALVANIKTNNEFIVTERFVWQQFATRNDSTWNQFVDIDSEIVFQNNRYLVTHAIEVETNINRQLERMLYQAISYKNIYSRDAAVQLDRQWYNVDLPRINELGLGSLDPIFVVSELLYNNVELYYKSDAGVTGDIRSYRTAVVTITDLVFESLFEHTIAPYVSVPYRYTVTAELQFDDAYMINEITFDLNRLLREYRDYYTVQQGVTFHSLSSQYSLNYHSYGRAAVPNLPRGLALEVTPQSLAVLEDAVDVSAVIEPFMVRTIDPATQDEQVTLWIRAKQPARLLLVEVLSLRAGQTLRMVQQQFINVPEEGLLSLQGFLDGDDIDELYVTVRFLNRNPATVTFETIRLIELLRQQEKE
jgi:hypothetical protein